jgi:hypothetical protein
MWSNISCLLVKGAISTQTAYTQLKGPEQEGMFLESDLPWELEHCINTG